MSAVERRPKSFIKSNHTFTLTQVTPSSLSQIDHLSAIESLTEKQAQPYKTLPHTLGLEMWCILGPNWSTTLPQSMVFIPIPLDVSRIILVSSPWS